MQPPRIEVTGKAPNADGETIVNIMVSAEDDLTDNRHFIVKCVYGSPGYSLFFYELLLNPLDNSIQIKNFELDGPQSNAVYLAFDSNTETDYDKQQNRIDNPYMVEVNAALFAFKKAWELGIVK